MLGRDRRSQRRAGKGVMPVNDGLRRDTAGNIIPEIVTGGGAARVGEPRERAEEQSDAEVRYCGDCIDFRLCEELPGGVHAAQGACRDFRDKRCPGFVKREEVSDGD